MAKVSSLAADYSVNHQTLVSKATLKLYDGIKAQLVHRSGSSALALTLSGKIWELEHDLQKKDTHIKCKSKVGRSILTITQHVPGGKWALVPNPVFELSRGGLVGRHSMLVCSWDFLNRVGKVEKTLYAGGDKQHKAFLKLSTAMSPTAGLRSKLPTGPLLHSAAASFSERGGLHLSAKSKFQDGTKVKTSYGVRSEVLSVAAKHTPRKRSPGAAKATLSLAMDISVKKGQDPKIKFGIKCDL